MTIAVVAALPEEIAPLVRRITGRGPAPRGRWLDGASAGHTLRLMVTGDGARRAGEGVRRLLAAERPAALIGFGAAGALTSDLVVGDLVLALEVVEESSGSTYRPPASRWLERGRRHPAARGGTFVTAAAVAVDLAAKQRLARLAAPPAVVDLESAAWAAAASAAQIPFVFARAVSDGWNETLPLDFEALTDRHGSISRLRVAAVAARRPHSWAALLRLRQRLTQIGELLADWAGQVLAP